jgi:predicted RNA-binding protein (virulence factor B family)
VEVEEFGLLRVVDTQNFGAFLDWGLEKDLFVPAKKQKTPMRINQWHLVRVCYDADSGKIFGTTKYNSFLDTLIYYFQEGDKVEVVPAEEHELGFRCILNRNFIGMIYHNEIFTDIELGETYEGYVKKIREDGLVDVALQVQGFKNLNESQIKILKVLEENGGVSDLHDKSSPDDIRQAFGMSKKTFKSAIGMLYKARKILISKTGIQLVKRENNI